LSGVKRVAAGFRIGPRLGLGRRLGQVEHDLLHAVLARIVLDAEAERLVHRQHRLVFAEDLALDGLDALGAGEFDHVFHQLPAKPLPFEVRAQQDGVFAIFMVDIEHEPHHAEHQPVFSSTATQTKERA